MFEFIKRLTKKDTFTSTEKEEFEEIKRISYEKYLEAVALGEIDRKSRGEAEYIDFYGQYSVYNYLAETAVSGTIWSEEGKIIQTLKGKSIDCFIDDQDQEYFEEHTTGQGQVYTLKGPRLQRQKAYIEFIERNGHKDFVSVDENIIKCTPYSNTSGIYWNKFHPIAAYHFTRFAQILLEKGIVKDYLLITSGFRSATYAVSLAQSNTNAVEWSPHRAGIAIDVAVLDATQRDAILSEANVYGFGGLGRGVNYCHLDIGAYDSWGYDGIDAFER